MPDSCSELCQHPWNANGELCGVDLSIDECNAFQICSSFSTTYKSTNLCICVCICIPGQIGCSFDVCIGNAGQVGCSFDIGNAV